jgi:hypothetical protein
MQVNCDIAKQKYQIIVNEIQNFLYFLNESNSRSHLPMHFCSPPFGLFKASRKSAISTSGNSEKHVALQVSRSWRLPVSVGCIVLWLPTCTLPSDRAHPIIHRVQSDSAGKLMIPRYLLPNCFGACCNTKTEIGKRAPTKATRLYGRER